MAAKKQYLIVNGMLRSVKPGNDVDAVVQKLKTMGRTVMKCKSPPSLKSLEKMSDNGVAKATDGCRVEPDGVCPHGHKSWLLVVGCI
jgi:hypothetical protein